MAAGRVEVARDSFITCGAFQQSEAHDLRYAQPHAVLPAERASSALRCAQRCTGEAVGPRMYHLYHLHVHVRDSRKVWSVILWTQVVHACVTCISMRE